MTVISQPVGLTRIFAKTKARRRPKPPTDPKWRKPKEYSLAAVLVNAHVSIITPVLAILTSNPIHIANAAYSLWTGYRAIQNVWRTFAAARMEADHRILGPNELPPVLPTTPSKSAIDSFNNISHSCFSIGIAFYFLPSTLPGGTIEQQNKTIKFSGYAFAMGLGGRGIAYLEKKMNGDDDKKPPKNGGPKP